MGAAARRHPRHCKTADIRAVFAQIKISVYDPNGNLRRADSSQ
jgi:hypothetical protein